MDAKRQKLSHIRLESILPDELTQNIPLIEVYTATIIDSRNISKVIIEVNEKIPVAQLSHLKRMKSKEILLFPTTWLDEVDSQLYTNVKTVVINQKLIDFLQAKQISIEYIDIEHIKCVKVAAIPPRTRRQFTIINKLWPCNFHSNKYIDSLVENTIFSTKELESHTIYLKLALELRKLSNNQEKQNSCDASGVVVTDPLRNDLVIAGGYSLTGNNPILHAAMLAIDNVAKTQNGGAYNEPHAINWDEILTYNEYRDVKVLRRDSKEIKIDIGENEYYCTNYNIYMSHEPCTMCAMALIHSRAKRVFYIFESTDGALGTKCKIHNVRDLNHHYEVFKVSNDDLCYFNS